MKQKQKKIVLVGGGTGGSVSPLLAIAEELGTSYSFVFVGGEKGPEKKMLAETSIPFKAIKAGKLRRYFSGRNISDLFLVFIGFFQAWLLLRKTKPFLVISSGSFISVPVILAAKLLGIKIWVHQQDLLPGLANKISSPFADLTTVTFEKTLNSFSRKALWIGNFARQLVLKEKNNNEKNILLFIGGGTGANFINNLALKLAQEKLEKVKIVLISGEGKRVAGENLTVYEFLPPAKLLDLMARSSLVVSRCGLGVLTELSALQKAVILIPMPDSHQEANAEALRDMAWQVLSQKDFSWENFVDIIEDFFSRSPEKKKSPPLIKIANDQVKKIVAQLYEK